MNSLDLYSHLFFSSTDINVRTKRSKGSANQSRRQGCSLGTCTVHDLAHRLHQLGNKLTIGHAPIDKISPQGYGRRRRSLPVRRVTLRLEQGRLRPVWSTSFSQVHKLEALLRQTWMDFARGVENKSEGEAQTWSPIYSVLKFSKCLRLLPSILQHICFRHQDWIRARLVAAELRSWDFAAPKCRAQQPQLAYRHWMAKSGANYRCCFLLGRGKGRVQIPGKVNISSGI